MTGPAITAVALLAIKPRLDMPFMGEIHIIREVVHLYPWYGFFLLPVGCKFFYLGGICFYDGVAAHGPFNVRHSRNPASFNIEMAVPAGDTIVSRMDFVAEFYGLLGSPA